MKFTDGYWRKRPGYTVEHPRVLQEVHIESSKFKYWALTRRVTERGMELDSPMLEVEVEAYARDIVRVQIQRYKGGIEKGPSFQLAKQTELEDVVKQEGSDVHLYAGELTVSLKGAEFPILEFRRNDELLTRSLSKSQGSVEAPDGQRYIHEQLQISVGEKLYGLGEQFGPVVKNGSTVEIWNEDGGTASDLAYKNVPFFLSNKGYGVFVNTPSKIDLEIGSEVTSRTQFSVKGEVLEYFILAGKTPKDVLERYTALTGRPPRVPEWSYGLWLSTSFKTDYSEEVVTNFLEEMSSKDIPVSVLHFDCYWMRPSHWCDFIWDPEVFKDPEGMLERLHEREVKVCVWINPYVAQRSVLFDEGKSKGYLLKDDEGNVKQWDHWQSGMAWVDFTNPDAVVWWKSQLKKLLDQGVDCFKTDFGERVPSEKVRWHNGADPERMHNYYSHLYNKAVFEVISEVKGEEDAILFARSGTTGGQMYPVHWSGDPEPTFLGMAETLRGGLSLGLSGYSYWSHDMGGFEGKPAADVFKRWYPFGMLSSHSRLHGSNSYRVPWLYGEEAEEVARRFTHIKRRLLPYIRACEDEAVNAGTPILRHMLLEFPDDPTVFSLELQYMFGENILVAPVFSDKGEVEYYLPKGEWTSLLTGEVRKQGWHKEVHGYSTLPLYLRPGRSVVVHNRREQGPESKLPEYLVLCGPDAASTGSWGSSRMRAGQHTYSLEYGFTEDGVELTVPDSLRNVSIGVGVLRSEHTHFKTANVIADPLFGEISLADITVVKSSGKEN